MARPLLEQEDEGGVDAFPGGGVIAEQGCYYETGVGLFCNRIVNTVTRATH